MATNKMKIINTKAFNKDSLKYSILASLHCYDTNHHCERITKLIPLEDKYDFTHNTPNKFEMNNPNISLKIYDENDNKIYYSSNTSTTKANIAKINDYRYVAINPLKNKLTKLNELIQSYSHHELRDDLFGIILGKTNDIDPIAEEIISPRLFY